MTEKAGQNQPVISFNNFIYKEDHSEDEIIKVLFQIIYAIYVMGQFRLMHNDLHGSNILVVKLSQKRKMSFTIGGRIFLINTRYIPYIFDWDRAYAEELGANPQLDKERCLGSGVCNRFRSTFDLYKMLCSIGLKIEHNPDLYPNLLQFLKATYLTRLFNMEQQFRKFETIKITLAEIKKIQQRMEPYYKNIYRISMIQLSEIVPNIFVRYPWLNNFTTISFNFTREIVLKKYEYTIEIYKGFTCNQISFDKRYPSAKEIITYTGLWTDSPKAINIFSKYETKQSPEQLGVLPEYRYIAPIGIIPIIHIDPYLETTRHKIKGRPRFKKGRGSGYVTLYGPRGRKERKS